MTPLNLRDLLPAFTAETWDPRASAPAVFIACVIVIVGVLAAMWAGVA